MAMLAEPRRRQKLSFDPRNKAWSEDTTKYGQKLMEKMGWSKGKGLGVKEDGNVSHVKVSLKNNNLGVGCKASQEDNWIAHQDDFNDLLSTLNQGHTPSTSIEREALSLEERSQQSRGKVRYKKFTRGKDLTKYGKEGMDSILGRRLISSAPVTPQTQSVENSEEEVEEESKDKELTHGVVTIKSSCSVGEYFAQKMSALRRPKRRLESESHSDTELEAPRCGFGFREPLEQGQRSDAEVAGPSRALGNEDGGNEEEEEQEMESEEGGGGSQRNRNKKKKKRKKKKAAARDSDEDEPIEVRGESDIEEDEGIDLGRKKKKNKKKKRLVDESKSESASEHNENYEKKKKKKTKKSKKDKNREEPGCSHDDDTAECSEERSSGETSKRKRDSSEDGLDEDRAETSSGKKKRKKTNRDEDADSLEGPSTSSKNKKKKKHKM